MHQSRSGLRHTNAAAATGSRSRPMSAASFSNLAPQGQASVASGAQSPGIEYDHHRVLAVALGEDDSRIHTGHAVHNMIHPHRIAHNLLPQDPSLKVRISNKRLAVAWNKAYLCRVVGLMPQTLF